MGTASRNLAARQCTLNQHTNIPSVILNACDEGSSSVANNAAIQP
jgi:hypothetical protein